MTLKYDVEVFKGCIEYREEHIPSKINVLLGVEDVDVSHHFVVAWYDCFRISYKDPSGNCAYIDVAHILEDKFYLLATAEPGTAAQSESVSIRPRSKLWKHCFKKNTAYYHYMQQKGFLGEHPIDNLAHISCPKVLKPIFEEFAASFEAPLLASDNESE